MSKLGVSRSKDYKNFGVLQKKVFTYLEVMYPRDQNDSNYKREQGFKKLKSSKAGKA